MGKAASIKQKMNRYYYIKTKNPTWRGTHYKHIQKINEKLGGLPWWSCG